MPKTYLNSKNMEARGTNRIEEPKPETVPIISHNNAKA